MKQIKPFLNISLYVLLSELVATVVLSTRCAWVELPYLFRNISLLLIGFWFLGSICLIFLKSRMKQALSRLLTIGSAILSGILLLFLCVCLMIHLYPDRDSFSTDTALFQGKDVMIIVPHQDDDINLAGGLIEQYTGAGSEVTVVFSTNGDRHSEAEIRAAEVVKVLTKLGVKQENICYLGFGDQWVSQDGNGGEIPHIYNTPDPEALWTSLHGATETYGPDPIPCYLNLPYTRNSYVYSLQSLILEKRPDTIFAVDFDDHIDHKGTDLFFEEALCNVLTAEPDYHPTVYKGFCYGTGWLAANDYGDSLNLLSSKQPDAYTWSITAYGYNWDARLRFPMDSSNLNLFLVNTSVFDSLAAYHSQKAVLQASRVLNGDKVFWQRRTDSLLYEAEFFADGLQTTRLNDFKLKDFANIGEVPGQNIGLVPLYGGNVSITLKEAVAVNCLYLYDNPDLYANILSGFIRFSDGSVLEFGPLHPDGSATVLTFPERQVSSMEIVITETDSNRAGFTEIEAYCDVPALQTSTDSYLMAVDNADNFVYDHILHGTDTLEVTIGHFPYGEPLGEADLTVTLSGKGTSCRWEADVLVINCPAGRRCDVTVSDGKTETTFTVSNPGSAEYAYLQALRFVESMTLNFRNLIFVTTDYIKAFLPTH